MSKYYSSGLFIEHFPFVQKLIIPIALKGIPVSSILRIITLICVVINLSNPEFSNYILQRNIIILSLITITFIFLLGDSDYGFLYAIAGLVLLLLIASIYKWEDHPSDSVINFLIFIWMLTSFFYIKDRCFYAKLLSVSHSVHDNNNVIETLYYRIKSLNYGKNYFDDRQTISILEDISSCYKLIGCNKLSEKANLLIQSKVKYLENTKYIFGQPYSDPLFIHEFKDFEEFKCHVEYQRTLDDQEK